MEIIIYKKPEKRATRVKELFEKRIPLLLSEYKLDPLELSYIRYFKTNGRSITKGFLMTYSVDRASEDFFEKLYAVLKRMKKRLSWIGDFSILKIIPWTR